MARLVALIPSPQVNLTRYHGVFAPNHPLRAKVVPGRERPDGAGPGTHPLRHVSMGWAKRLKGVFGIEVERCDQWGGGVKIIAAIENPAVINKILEHLGINRERPVNRLARGSQGLGVVQSRGQIGRKSPSGRVRRPMQPEIQFRSSP